MANTLVFAYYDSGVEYDAFVNSQPLCEADKGYAKDFYELFGTKTFVDVFSQIYNCDIYIINNGYIEYFSKENKNDNTHQ